VIAIDWASAQVRDARLRVGLSERAPEEWVETAEAVVERLGRSGHQWGEVKLTRKRVEVADVVPGAEESLKHFLESALLQANSELPEDDEDEDDAEVSDEDRQMTETFRAFGES
jgi:hypothetical protein